MEIHNDVYNHINDATINNIESHEDFGGKLLGVESNIDTLNEHKKCIGRILLLNDAPKFRLDQYIEFREDKIKLRPSKYDDEGRGLYLINPYWCKKYEAKLKIDVPVRILLPKENRIIIETRRWNYDQFIASRMIQFKRDWPHIYVVAVENCRKLFPKGRGYALNATVRNYMVDKEKLKECWGKHSKYMATINAEWNRLFKDHYINNTNFQKLHNFNEKRRLKEIDGKVIEFRKNG